MALAREGLGTIWPSLRHVHEMSLGYVVMYGGLFCMCVCSAIFVWHVCVHLTSLCMYYLYLYYVAFVPCYAFALLYVYL